MDTEEMTRLGAEDAARGAPHPFYYQHYYSYRKSYDRARRQYQSPLRRFAWLIGGVVLVAAVAWVAVMNARTAQQPAEVVIPTALPRATVTPRPLFPTPTTSLPTALVQPGAAGLQISGTATISNTGGRTLRGRAEPSLKAAIRTTFAEGEQVNVLEGPVEADGLRWWKIASAKGDGWSAEQSSEGDVWLVPVP